MNAPDPVTVGGYIVALITSGMAAFERYRSSRSNTDALKATERAQQAEAAESANKEVLGAKDELIRLARDSSTQWKERCSAEHAEFAAYREKHHQQIQDAQATILKQAEEIANLRARTDITPVMETLKDILESLESILQRLDSLTPKP
jgi:hypothetical protein